MIMIPIVKIVVIQAKEQDVSQTEVWLGVEPRAAVTYINDASGDTETLAGRLKNFDIIYVTAGATALTQRDLYKIEGIKFIIDERKGGTVQDVSEWLDDRVMEVVKNARQPDEYNSFLDTIRQGYDEDYPETYLKEVGQYILNQAEVGGPEYRLICWLFYRGIMSNPGINVPYMPEKLPDAVNIAELHKDYSESEKRKLVLKKLQNLITKYKHTYQINETVKIIIGGSFADPTEPLPGDIDCIILVPQAIWDASPHRFAANFAHALNINETLIDYKLLPDNFDLKSFKAYSDLSLMANKTRFRKVKMAHNFFEPRDLLVLMI